MDLSKKHMQYLFVEVFSYEKIISLNENFTIWFMILINVSEFLITYYKQKRNNIF